jgi:hypothetical protein
MGHGHKTMTISVSFDYRQYPAAWCLIPDFLEIIAKRPCPDDGHSRWRHENTSISGA